MRRYPALFAYLDTQARTRGVAAPDTYKDMGLSSGVLAIIEHYERLMAELRDYASNSPPLDDMLPSSR